ncbi:hypothetical protein F5Y05DRAFT_422982 [Hypoxylon sp. FL0543]|nr:hypothetical protein F5Y05DRAFT_422982 [Hypoxylon sp. FL0543]
MDRTITLDGLNVDELWKSFLVRPGSLIEAGTLSMITPGSTPPERLPPSASEEIHLRRSIRGSSGKSERHVHAEYNPLITLSESVPSYPPRQISNEKQRRSSSLDSRSPYNVRNPPANTSDTVIAGDAFHSTSISQRQPGELQVSVTEQDDLVRNLVRGCLPGESELGDHQSASNGEAKEPDHIENQWSLETYPELTGIARDPQGSPKRPAARAQRGLPGESNLPDRRSLRNILKQTAIDHDMRETVVQTQSTRKKRKEIVRSNNRQRPSPPSGPGTPPKEGPGKINSPAGRSTSTVDAAQILELETWEVAPGRIRDEEKDAIDNFAFSNTYLAQNHAVRISRDVSFQVITIKPGTVHEWQACAKSFRLCSVASGKLQVTIHNQQFPIGPNGMIMIRPGAGCTVMNRLYVDATVHVTVVPSDLYG